MKDDCEACWASCRGKVNAHWEDHWRWRHPSVLFPSDGTQISRDRVVQRYSLGRSLGGNLGSCSWRVEVEEGEGEYEEPWRWVER